MCLKKFLKPTDGKLIFAILLYIAGWYSYLFYNVVDFGILTPLALLIILPHVLIVNLGSASMTPIIIGIITVVIFHIYWYLLSCIYVSAYQWLELKIRKNYPGINAGWEKKKAKNKSKKDTKKVTKKKIGKNKTKSKKHKK